jgi:hypothetical protein
MIERRAGAHVDGHSHNSTNDDVADETGGTAQVT